MARQFIVGRSPEDALAKLEKMRQRGLSFTVDLLGEACLGETEAEDYLVRYEDLIKALSGRFESSTEKPDSINISIKLSSLYSQSRSLNFSDSVEILSNRLIRLLLNVRKNGGTAYVDMEDCSQTDITLAVIRRAFSHAELRDYPHLGIVIQAYLRRSHDDLCSLLDWVKLRGAPIAVRLVKGAYWDSETILARINNWPIPVWGKKQNSDFNYELLTRFLLDNSKFFYPAFASHNIRSLSHAATYADSVGVAPKDFELQVLYGMGDEIAQAFIRRGIRVRAYAPVGELIPGMAYLVRRLLENTSNEGFLKQTFQDRRSSTILLAKPLLIEEDTGMDHLKHNIREEFFTCPFTDFSLESERTVWKNAVNALQERLKHSPATILPIVNGESIQTKRSLDSIAPEDPTIVVAKVGIADATLAERAVNELHTYFPTFRNVPVESRTEMLFKAAATLQIERAKFAAAIIMETGKPWAEADGDVAEAVDFLNYYALEAKKLFSVRQMGEYVGELNHYFYEPRGVAVVIPPWNFSLAIPCGMFASAIVTGNCAILKPAEQSSYVAKLLFDLMIDSGVPAKAIAFLPAIGEEVGPTLVNHPAVTTIAFTGSKQVGLQIVQSAAESSSTAIHVKRVIAEMGGKNAIIIDNDADLDEAVKGTISSAFNYAGQKCSACSMAIIVGDHYNRFKERLVDAVRSVAVGKGSNPRTTTGPVIDEQAFQRIKKTIAAGQKTATLVIEGGDLEKELPSGGFYIRPTIFENVSNDDPLLTEEIFGPVLVLRSAKTFEEAVAMAQQTEYALTGAVFSRSPMNIEYARREFRVGNLYINRGCTGALVYRQPFGGARMSGVGSKAGGPDYLLQFVIPRVISENTMRRGTAPDLT
jgi:RHH-type proline utilization regulon transcriptional repressor/proline dehydrogenase/delta 1-pyrroline-5-carboxylate dehydrogenase